MTSINVTMSDDDKDFITSKLEAYRQEITDLRALILEHIETGERWHKMPVIESRTSLSRRFLHDQIKDGKLKAVKVGNALRISESELLRFMATCQQGGE